MKTASIALAVLLSAPVSTRAQTAPAANPLAAEAGRLSVELNPQVVAWRRDFHKNPELGKTIDRINGLNRYRHARSQTQR